MARIRKEDLHVARRSEILEVAQRLIATKGYEQMTIADIQAELGISKGAFYHYFDSKASLLEALIERMRGEAEKILMPIFHDPELSALEKIQRWFETTARWKTAHKAYLLSLLRVWYHDDNAVVVQKLRSDTARWIVPHLTDVVRQGIQEKVFRTSYPDHVGRVVTSLLYDLGDALGHMILSPGPNGAEFRDAEATAAAYTDALERALGAAPGSLLLVDAETLREWFVEPVAVI
jgi:AcrR family transcriptional regulator